MESQKTGIAALGARLVGVAVFFIVSVLDFAVTTEAGLAHFVQLGVAVSYVVLAAGIWSRRPDAEVLAWFILGTATLLSEAGSAEGSLWLGMATGVAVVAMADFQHSAAMVYTRSGNEVVDFEQDSARLRLLKSRGAAIVEAAGAGLILSLVGVSLSPEIVLPGLSPLLVGIVAVAAIAIAASIVAFDLTARPNA
ncbi:MAG: hypothetical protein JRN28_00785 [Nitrososphaerota archaeon]|nr:hypothetical protein [Nitrososphaerota archaeon]